MDLEKDFVGGEERKGIPCSICFDLVLDRGERSIAKLQCGHEFHLDCIGSAFNSKGAMQCPNCRKVEKGRWLFANGQRSSVDFDLDGLVTEDFYDFSYHELPLGLQWCPFRGFTQLFEEGESQLNSYHESLASAMFGDQPNASNGNHTCPYLALHGHPHAMHAAPPSGSADSVIENGPFSMHPTSSGGGQASSDMLNSHSFPAAEPLSHNWQQQQHSPPFSLLGGAADQSASQYGPRLSRSDPSSQQRLGPFVHPHPLLHGSISRNGNNLVAPLGPPVMGPEVRGHAHTRSHGGSHIYQQQPLPSSSLRSSPFSHIRRSRPRGLTLISSVAATSSSADIGGLYGFTQISGSANRSHQDAESVARHFDRLYGWGGREGFTPLPWIPLEGESHWWNPFNPNQNHPQSGGSFLQRTATAAERVGQNRPENGYQRIPPLPPHPRMPPPSYM